MRFHKAVMVLALLWACGIVHAQNVNLTFNNGSAQLQYVCEAPVQVALTSVQVSDASLTNIVVATNVGTVTAPAHGLWTGARVIVSGSATTALNGTYTVTVTGTNAYTIVTAGVSDATYADAGLVIQTRNPLQTNPVWRVTVLHYASTVLDIVYLGGSGLSLNYKAKCSDRATY